MSAGDERQLAQRCPTCGGLVEILTDRVEGTSFMRSVETGALEDLVAAQEAVELEAESAAAFQRQRNMAAADVESLRAAIDHAIRLLGPGDDEDSDSPGNMAFAVLMATRTQP